MDETVVVAGYSKQGMEAWDVRTQQSLCTFSNFEHGGVKSLQFDSRKLVTVSQSGNVSVSVHSTPMYAFFERKRINGFCAFSCFVGCALEMVFAKPSALVHSPNALREVYFGSVR